MEIVKEPLTLPPVTSVNGTDTVNFVLSKVTSDKTVLSAPYDSEPVTGVIDAPVKTLTS